VSIFLRSFFFNVILFGITFPALSFLTPFLFLPYDWVLRIPEKWCKINAWLLKKIVGLDFKIEGAENILKTPAIFASKHQSAWETLIFNVVLKNPSFVLKKELMWVPIFGWFLKKTGAIPIDRGLGSKSLKFLLIRAQKSLDENHSIIIFPEGTRSDPGKSHKYQRGIALLYQALKVPVVPVALNSGLFWGRRDFKKKPGVVTLKFLPPILPGLSREEFMNKLEDSIETESLRLVQEVKGLENLRDKDK
jgi:1-acyl-sn-glycerol-3-phosphate acyltransferase